MLNTNVQQTIRIPEKRNERIKEKADIIGCSYNSLINVLIDLGLRAYESGIYTGKPNQSSSL